MSGRFHVEHFQDGRGQKAANVDSMRAGTNMTAINSVGGYCLVRTAEDRMVRVLPRVCQKAMDFGVEILVHNHGVGELGPQYWTLPRVMGVYRSWRRRELMLA